MSLSVVWHEMMYCEGS